MEYKVKCCYLFSDPLLELTLRSLHPTQLSLHNVHSCLLSAAVKYRRLLLLALPRLTNESGNWWLFQGRDIAALKGPVSKVRLVRLLNEVKIPFLFFELI